MYGTGQHYFTASNLEVPLSVEDDEHLREEEEAGLCPRSLLQDKVILQYVYDTAEETFYVLVERKKRLPSYNSDRVTLVKASGTSLENLKEALSSISLERLGNRAPTLDDLIEEGLGHIERHAEEIGFDFRKSLDRMDKKMSRHPRIPAPPVIKGERGLLNRSAVAAEKCLVEHGEEMEILVTFSEKNFILGTALPGLKGANRVIATRNPAYSLFPACHFVKEFVKEEMIGPQTHFEDMPERLQTEVGTRLFTLEESDLQPMKKLLRHFSNNADLSNTIVSFKTPLHYG